MNKLDFKRIDTSDMEIVLTILEAAAMGLKSKGIDQWSYWLDPPESKKKWLLDGLTNKEFYFLKQADETLGMIRILESDELYWGKQNEAALYIHSLVVQAEFKGRGLGVKAMLKVEEIAREKKINFLRLDCVSENQDLCNYYIQQGFKIVGKKQMPLSENTLFQKDL
ncbi:GNAT family N-acetyltransferase [Saprospiraceae bacterium]|nr:GNAT family N-acetyltransferase [Saprospiraceae bacterium]